ncbi:hypothetical protein QT971_31245 [Microcoleus sp. herbarium19]
MHLITELIVKKKRAGEGVLLVLRVQAIALQLAELLDFSRKLT